MNEDTTRELPGASPFEQRVIAEFAAMRAEMRNAFANVDARLTALEQQAAQRARQTTPLWENMQATLDEINSQLRLVVADLFKTRARVEDLERRNERQPAA